MIGVFSITGLVGIFGIDSIAIDPLLSIPIISVLGGLAVFAAIIGALGRLKTLIPRLIAALALILALLNPQTVIEEKDPLKDVVLVLKDQSESISLGTRSARMDRAYSALQSKLQEKGNLEIVNAVIPASTDGTRMTTALIEALSDIPRERFAGVIALTDGQIHDLPKQVEALLPEGVPFHGLITGDPNVRDRRIRALLAPKYGLVGEQAEFEVMVDDDGFEGERAQIEIKVNGDLQGRFSAVIGDKVSIPVEIERRGTNTIELSVQSVEGELTRVNNTFVSEFSGIRDRMRVLLVTGYPHNGGRAWRNLLKSDPSVDLVQFTILTNPRVKNPNAGQRELSLIAFPTRQLFEEKLTEFDLIIFDQFRRRFTPGRSGRAVPILQPYYLQNIAEYVESGGALLVAAGPSFASEESLYRSPLAAVLPTRPTGEMLQEGFTPELNENGRRHPITAPFAGKDDQTWGRWFRIIESNVVSGNVLMEGPDAEPLLVIEKVGKGRVGMVLSDQAWLWAKGFESGGPYSEMFRRLSHWLMGEPDLSAEKVSGRIENNALKIERRTLTDDGQAVTVERPDGTSETVTLSKASNGVYRGELPVTGQGAYRISDGDISTVAAAGSLNPKEFSNLRPTADILRPLTNATGGGVFFTSKSGTDIDEIVPEIRAVKTGKSASGDDWMGLRAYDAFTVRDSRRAPFAPGLVFFLIALLGLSWAWWREGR